MGKRIRPAISFSALMAWALAVSAVLYGSQQTNAQISYSVMDSTITQDFNSLPTDLPQNANIQTVYTGLDG